ncbi:hypothetical protein OZX69_09575 (plasmid) [Lactobacillus sp. ESL0731]|uniref:hypothetical protein n=1 Tax=unclassified Lactobacillus TaxID=2620435 RepID=UPI0023F7FC34|nr:MULTISPECIES: hypothetical protein [unclassified Lactobacillus]WEV52108.1 hypothetical protein OZX63_09455 [Lactobacillus sp. ESL0700]WEV63259.1 hypothetical protein OZX69_09575 [Lactobacillus sp. ESL0731]
MEEVINHIYEIFGLEPPKKNDKPEEPYGHRRKYIRKVYIFLGIIFLGFTIPIFITNNNRYAAPTITESEVTESATLKKIKSQYNPNTHLMVSEFFIGNQNQIDSTSDDKNLANLKYDIGYKIQNKKPATYPTKVIRVNDHFIVIETQNVTPGFGLLEYDIWPEKIDADLNTDCENKIVNAYIEEHQVSQISNLTAHNKQYYEQKYKEFALQKYSQQLKNLNNDIKKKHRIISDDNKMLDKLNMKLASAMKEDKSDLQDQINETENDISVQNNDIKHDQISIAEYQKRIDRVNILEQTN